MRLAVLILQCVALAVALTWPLVLDPAGKVLGSPKGDAIKHVWNLWWMHREWSAGPWGLQTTLVNFPSGMELYPIEVTNGLLTAWLPLPPVLAANLLALGHVVALGLCTAWLAHEVGATRLGTHVAAAMAQGSAFTAFTLHAGVGELRQSWWVPLGLALAVRARRLLTPAAFAQLGLCMAAATLACFYHGFFLATAVGVYAVATFRPRREVVLGWALGALVCVLLVVPLVKLFATNYQSGDGPPDVGFLAWMARGPMLDSYAVTSLQPEELFRYDGRFTTDLARPFEPYLGGRYLGGAALLLALVGLATAPRRAAPWLGVALVGILLACGNTLWWGGKVLSPAVVLPLGYVNQALSWVAEPLNFPVRYLVITNIAVAVLAGLASQRRWVVLLVPVALAEVAWADAVPFPRSQFVLEGAPDVEAPEGAVLELSWATRADAVAEARSPVSLFDATLRARSVAAQVYLDRPFQSIAVERVDHWATDGMTWSAALPLVRSLAGAATTAEARTASVALLWDRGFRSVWMGHPCGGGKDWPTVERLTAELGRPLSGACGDLWVLRRPDHLDAATLAAVAATVEADARRIPSPQLGAPKGEAAPASPAPDGR